jgi:hypothetical protein
VNRIWIEQEEGTAGWTAMAGPDYTVDYDANGATPLDAINGLARLLYEELDRATDEVDGG